ncbi:hypothetical protein AMECASPLE_021329 [Ameca splendens]|uniref:SP-RING-type domain-containing protein n=1 Tax=Ameca splendens TaxID=208324 RepID=A0ABV0ZDL5_9TELE
MTLNRYFIYFVISSSFCVSVKEKLTADPDSEIATTSLRVSLLCPLGKMRLTVPCRAVTCSHLQCFDAALYLQMNEKKPSWICPVCDKNAAYENLIIDGWREWQGLVGRFDPQLLRKEFSPKRFQRLQHCKQEASHHEDQEAFQAVNPSSSNDVVYGTTTILPKTC